MMFIAIVTTGRGVFVYDTDCVDQKEFTKSIQTKHRYDANCKIKISTPWSRTRCVPVIEGAL